MPVNVKFNVTQGEVNKLRAALGGNFVGGMQAGAFGIGGGSGAIGGAGKLFGATGTFGLMLKGINQISNTKSTKTT